jgi:hypothetical protein
MRRILLSLLVLLASASLANAQVVAAPKCGGATLTNNVYRFCYDGSTWLMDEPANARFTNGDRVEVQVLHLNYLRYTLSFDVQEQKSESYQYLNKLWTSVLGIGFGSLGGILSPPGEDADLRKKREAAENLFLDRLRQVLRYAEALDTHITVTIGEHRRPGLNQAEVTALRNSVGTGSETCSDVWTTGNDPLLTCPIAALSTKLTEKYTDLERGVHTDTAQFALATGARFGELYEKIKKAYAEVITRSDQFRALAVKTLTVTTRQVGKRDAGTKVTLTLAAVDAGGGRSPIGDVSYIVETTIPLVVHGGMAFSSLNDVTFEKVKRSNGFSEDDVFQKSGDNANSRNFTLFMGWRFASFWGGETPNSKRLSALISLGTDVDKPGKKIYIAPTLVFFNRVALSGGAALGKELNGEQQTLEPDVFKIIKAKPTATKFFSISTRIF